MTRDELNTKFYDELRKRGKADLGDTVGCTPVWDAFETATHGLCDDDTFVTHAGGSVEQRLYALEETISALGRALR